MSDSVTDAPGTSVRASASLGARVRDLRRARGLTLVELAERSGLSHPFLSQVERDLANPSIRSLGSIAHALGTSRIELLAPADETPATAVSVVPRGTAARGDFGNEEAQLLISRPDARFRPLSIRGFTREFGDVYFHDEHEFLHVVAGRVEVELDGQCQTLEPGDSVYYGGGVPHRWRALDAAGYHVLVVKERPHVAPQQDGVLA
ncbi:helix-turn-helix domain-containing protein [Demequina sp. NBRC 110055]|uniref:helix-turn-helix domain-containing protein n=1 Tax=Demequina sp. NBRC 110055 TaxID=1570344 RepID=UPI001186E302|nr:XRE family transcriptional regulator [Demequina sp. NBRC 110055]